MRKITKSGITRKLDKIVSDITRASGLCAWCGSSDYSKLQCAHIYSRKWKSVRWDLKNVVCLCASCHFYGHQNPIAFTDFIKGYLGEYEFQQLKLRAMPTSHHKLNDLISMYETLKKECLCQKGF